MQGEFTFFNLTKIAYADGTSASFTYDSNGNVNLSQDVKVGALVGQGAEARLTRFSD